MSPSVRSVNLGAPSPGGDDHCPTGIRKAPAAGPVTIRDPGDRRTGLGSGVEGDFIGSRKHHGGSDQAVYAVAREELDHWSAELGRELTDGCFGENLTTLGLAVDGAIVGEIWQVGPTVRLQVTSPRIPCRTFATAMGVPRWVKRYAARGHTGAYLRVLTPGPVQAGDPIVVESRPDHGITVPEMFRIVTTEKDRIGELAVIDDLCDQARRDLDRWRRRQG